MFELGIDDVRAAALRIAPYVHRTPVMESRIINDLAGCNIYFKAENLQRCGAFKARGAHNAALQLSAEQLRRGVATHSSGNHGAALALAAKTLGSRAIVVMPESTAKSKIAAVKHYGGEVRICEATMVARENTLDQCVKETGATFIPPYDSAEIICGQGTAALELIEQVEPSLDCLMAPIGGGGLLAGTSLVGRGVQGDIEIIGAEPQGADDAAQSFRNKKWQAQLTPNTIADGLRSSTGKLNFRIILDLADDILTVDDHSIAAAMALIWSRMKLVVEASSAVPLAAILGHPERFYGKHVGVILSGGNVDLDQLPWLKSQ